jgi:vanillate O-demethylase ferredoxin subunit
MMQPADLELNTPARGDGGLYLRLTAIRYVSPGVNAYEFSSPDGAALPPVLPGAHLDLYLPNGLVRQYSLLLPQTDCRTYAVAVKREPTGSGGSQYIHDQLRVGMLLQLGLPRNHFQLHEAATHSVLIAGGIGITPILGMARHLEALGRPWELHFAAPTHDQAPFLADVQTFPAARFAASRGAGGRRLDLAAIVAAAPPGAHLYCCGPGAMLEAFQAATQGWSPEQIHVEFFATQQEAATAAGLLVELARSGIKLLVGENQTILDALLDAGIDVPYSCSKGICGACEITVLEGVPDHRDSVLSPAEQASNRTMMVCCSGSLGSTLKLDL